MRVSKEFKKGFDYGIHLATIAILSSNLMDMQEKDIDIEAIDEAVEKENISLKGDQNASDC